MKEILFEVSTFLKSSMFGMSWHITHAIFQSKTVGYAHSPNSLALSSQFSSVLILDLKRIADEVKATTVVLQGQQPRHVNGIYLPKGIAKEQGHGKTSYKVLV